MSRSSVGRSTAATPSTFLSSALLGAQFLLVPLFFLPGLRDAFRMPKLLLAGVFGLASLLALAWEQRAQPPRGFRSPREFLRHPAVLAVLPFLAVAGASLLWTPHLAHAKQAFFDCAIGAACLLGWSLALPSERIERWLASLLWGGALLSIFAILQYFDLWTPLRFAGLGTNERLGITSLAGNPGDLGAYLALPAALGPWALARAAGRRRIAVAAAWGLGVVGLALSQTLAALLALAVGWAIYGALALPRRRVILGFGALVLAGALALGLVAPLRQRVVNKLGPLARGDWNEVLTGRLDGWRVAMHLFAAHPWAGVGHGGFRPSYVSGKLALLERGTVFYKKQASPVFANAHNEYLETAADLGVPGILALLGGVALAFRGAARKPKEGGRRALAWSGLAVLAVLSLAYFPFRIALTAYPAILFLAWLFVPADDAASDRESQS